MAGDLSDRNLTLGAPDAIKDMLYGNTYIPYIKRAYKGSTLIFDREPDNWLYHIENVDCNKAFTVDNYKELQPEYIYYIHENIQPFLYENHKRDWEFLINVSESRRGSDYNVIPLLTTIDNVYENTQDAVRNDIGGPNVELYLSLKVNSAKKNDTIRIRGSNHFAPYSESDKFNSDIEYDKSTYGSIVGKDIHVIKQLEYENESWINKIYFYISGLLVTTLVYDPICTSRARVGSIMQTRASRQFFDGSFKYVKFRYNNYLQPEKFTMNNISLPMPQPADFDDYRRVETTKTITEYTTTTYTYGTAYVTELITKVEYKNGDRTRMYHQVSGVNPGAIYPKGVEWAPYYNQLVDPNVDGFGVTVHPVDKDKPDTQFYNSFFEDDTATEWITRCVPKGVTSRASNSTYPFILNGGGWGSSYREGNVVVIYRKGTDYITEEVNNISLMGPSAAGVVKSNATTTAIYFKSIKQMVCFDENGDEIYISSVYEPSVFDETHDNGLCTFGTYNSDGVFTTETYSGLDGDTIKLFTIKYNTEDEDNENA